MTAAPSLPDPEARFSPRRWRAAVAPTLALVGLVLATGLSVAILLGRFDFGLGTSHASDGGHTPNASVVITPAPSPEATPPFLGSILFAQGGNIWSISGTAVTQLSQTGHDAMPAWTPDGDSIVLIETRSETSRVACAAPLDTYRLDYPVIVRMAADGSGRVDIKSGLTNLAGGTDRHFFRWLLQPDVSPDGKTVALISDAQDPCTRTTALSHVTLATVPLAGGGVKSLGVPDEYPQGHDDPAWSPDGTQIAFTYNARSGAVGAPRIGILTVAGRSLRILIKGGYAQPSWSPDGRFLAAVRTTGSARDIVIVRVKDGTVVDRLTADGKDFAPVWAPDGSGIAYLKLTAAGVDLHLLQFQPAAAEGDAPTLVGDIALTSDADIEPDSRPSWFIPPDLLPSPSPSPTTSPSPSPGGSAP
jgi:Tol biopolymer transport system component